MSLKNQLFYSGTSGLVVPVKSKIPIDFLDKSRLHYYASLFNSIEINSIFYKLPRKSTVINWADSVDDDFKFTFKVSKSITHAKGLEFNENDVYEFLDVVENAGNKKGCLLAQFPPSIKFDKLNSVQKLLEIFHKANKNKGWRLAMEFRDSSWHESEVIEILEEYDATMVIHDLNPKTPELFERIKSDFIYLRFHGPEPRYRGDYNDIVLRQYADFIKKWISERKIVYTYFNNTMGAAFSNLQTLNKFVKT